MADPLLNAVVKRRIALGRYSNATARKVLALLSRTERSVVARLLEAQEAGRSTVGLEALLRDIRARYAEGWATIRGELTEDLDGLALVERDFAGRLVREAAPRITAALGLPTDAQVVAAVNSRPFQGRLLREWLADAEEGAARRVRDTIRQGFVEGRPVDQIARTIRGTRALQYRDGILEISRRGAEAMVRTAITHTAASAANETYKAMGDLVQGVEWVSILDSRTSVICGARDGQVYPLDSGPRPPAHINCRSTVIPRIDGVEPIERTTFQEWLAKQPAEVQDDILGPSKAKLFRSGNLTLDRFVDRSGKELTLDQLRAL